MEAFKVDFIKRVTQSAGCLLPSAGCSVRPGQAEACMYGLVRGRGRAWPLKPRGHLCNILHSELLPNLVLYLKNSKDFSLNLQSTRTFWRVGAICTDFKVPHAYLPATFCPTRLLLRLFPLPLSIFVLLRVNEKTRGWSRSQGTSLSWQSWVIYWVLLPSIYWALTKPWSWEYNGKQDMLLPQARKQYWYWSRMWGQRRQ